MKTKLFKTLAFVIVLSIALSSFASALAATPIIITGTNGWNQSSHHDLS